MISYFKESKKATSSQQQQQQQLLGKRSIGSETDDERKGAEEGDDLFLERKFAEEFVRNKKTQERDSIDSRLRYNNEKLDFLEQKLNEITESRLMDYNEIAAAINWFMSQHPTQATEEISPPYMKTKVSTKKFKQWMNFLEFYNSFFMLLFY